MNNKGLAILAIVTLCTIIIAAVVVNKRQAAVKDVAVGASFFPELEAQANDIAQVEIVSGVNKVTLKKDNDLWRIEEKSGYPANLEKIKEVVLAIARFKNLEAKTSRPEQYEKIGVTDPALAEGLSTGVSLKDSSGKTLAAVILGSVREPEEGEKEMLYVRRMSEPQAWLVEGKIEVAKEPVAWLSKERVLDVPRTRVKSVTIMQPNGERMRLAKEQRADKDYKLFDVPKKKRVRTQAGVNDLATALENMVPDDVEPSLKPEQFAGGVVAEVRTYDGLVVKVLTLQKEGKSWVKFESAYDASAAQLAAGNAQDDPAGFKTPVEIKKDIENMEQKLGRWAFAIPAAKQKFLVTKTDELVVTQGE